MVKSLALLDLPEAVQEAVDDGKLPASAAYEVSKLEGPEVQAEVARAVVDQGLRRLEVSELVSAIRAKRPAPAARPEPVTLDIGDVAVRITWKRSSGIDLVKALKLALKRAQDRQRDDQAA